MNQMKEWTKLMEWIEQLLKNNNPMALQYHPWCNCHCQTPRCGMEGLNKLIAKICLRIYNARAFYYSVCGSFRRTLVIRILVDNLIISSYVASSWLSYLVKWTNLRPNCSCYSIRGQ